jgi:hypothetical protein
MQNVIIDGASSKITLTIPSAAKQLGIGVFEVEPNPGERFTSIVVTGSGVDREFPIAAGSDDWKIVIK